MSRCAVYCRFIFFATHYHQLTRLSDIYPNVKNAHLLSNSGDENSNGGQTVHAHVMKPGLVRWQRTVHHRTAQHIGAIQAMERGPAAWGRQHDDRGASNGPRGWRSASIVGASEEGRK